MDRVAILCDKDREMMHEFSRRSLQRLNARPLLSVLFSFGSLYMEANVKKEVEKDRLVIEETARAFEAGQPACDLDLEDLFEKTKGIDKQFLDRLVIPSFSFSVRYSDFSDIRIRRIWLLASTVYALLEKWPEAGRFPDAVRFVYTGREFKKILTEVLHLYTQETTMLGNAVRSPFRKSITAYLTSLFDAMESSTEELAANCTKKIFGDEIVHA